MSSNPLTSSSLAAGNADDQTAAGAQLAGSQGKKAFPITCALLIERGAHFAGASQHEEMAGNPRGNTTDPHGGVGTPTNMDAAGRENVFVERPADRAGKYVRLIQDITLRIVLQVSNSALKSFAGKST